MSTRQRPTPAQVAPEVRRLLDAQAPGWRDRHHPVTGRQVTLVTGTIDVDGFGEMAVVLFARGGFVGEALPDEVIDWPWE